MFGLRVAHKLSLPFRRIHDGARTTTQSPARSGSALRPALICLRSTTQSQIPRSQRYCVGRLEQLGKLPKEEKRALAKLANEIKTR